MKIKKSLIGIVGLSIIPMFLVGDTFAIAQSIPESGFENGTMDGWGKGSQSGSLSNGVITGNGTGVTLINEAVTFAAPSHNAVGNPTLPNGEPNLYYAPAVTPTSWTFSPYGTYAVALQPIGGVSFDAAISSLGLGADKNEEIKNLLIQQQQASGLGNPNPTNASWITKTVTLSANTVYTMSWNYIGTDYVPYNDGSITSLTPINQSSTADIIVNNQNSTYALLGFTNPGTGDYSTGTYGSTGWQVSTYQVSESGEYLLGFSVFNLGDTALSPVLLVDSQPGTTLKNGENFGAVAPNNPEAPTIPPSTEPPSTEPPVTEPPVTEPPVTEPPVTEAPTTEAPETTEPITTTPEETTTIVFPIYEVINTQPEQTTSTIVNVETTLPNIPNDSSAPVDSLPKTGSDNKTVGLGLLILVAGVMILGIRRSFRNEHLQKM